MNTDKILTIPAEEYHAESRNGRYMSSHLLADFRESPELYHRKVTGEIAQTESPALALGRAAHCLILEGRMAFDDQYLVSDGPVNARTNEPYGKTTKSYSDWLAVQTKEVLSCRDYGFITKLQKSVWLHDVATQLLDKGSPEGVLRAEYCGVPCQIRMDWFSPEYGLVDLKTCDSLKWFENDCRRYGYLYQMAFYHAVIEKALDVSVPVHIIAVEKNEPFSAGVWELSPGVLEEAKQVNEAALARYRKCLYTGHWPTGYEGTRIISSL